MNKFRELQVGDTFDFIGPDRMLNSFYARCVKLSSRCYVEVEHRGSKRPVHHVGSINANVYHVEAKTA